MGTGKQKHSGTPDQVPTAFTQIDFPCRAFVIHSASEALAEEM